ncbi:MAG TPA: hypothetical protein VH478_16890 [Trebonia sp.]|jgi:hypothetical protein|nr:hypothetical protein [Trebonia sp.]
MESSAPEPVPEPGSIANPPLPPEPQPAPDPERAVIWPFLVSRKWLLWHVTAAAGVWGMLWLGDWQYHRAVGGNGLSWAYTFEWPLFAVFGVVFWAKTIRDEFRIRRAGLDPNLAIAGTDPGVQLPAGLGTEQAGSYVGGAPGDPRWTGADGAEPVLAAAWRADMVQAAAQWTADPELAEYNMRLATLNAKAKAKEQSREKGKPGIALGLPASAASQEPTAES